MLGAAALRAHFGVLGEEGGGFLGQCSSGKGGHACVRWSPWRRLVAAAAAAEAGHTVTAAAAARHVGAIFTAEMSVTQLAAVVAEVRCEHSRDTLCALLDT